MEKMKWMRNGSLMRGKKKRKMALSIGLLALMAALVGCGNSELATLKTERYVTLGDYTGLEITVPAAEVTDEYQQNYINYVLSEHSEWTDASERPAQSGDLVNIDYEGKKDGVAFENGSDQGYDLELGSGVFIEGFEDGLIGTKAGETRELELTFPDPYPNNPDLAGAPVVFTVTVNSIQEKQTPELTDEFVQTLGVDCDTVEEYKSYVKELLLASAQETYDTNVQQALIEAASAVCTFREDPPTELVDSYYDRIIRNLTATATASGMSLDTMISQYYQISMEEFEEQVRESATKSSREAIMLQAIANQEGIAVSQEDIDEALAESAEEGGYESVDALKEEIGEDEALYENSILCDRVLSFLRESAVITEQ